MNIITDILKQVSSQVQSEPTKQSAPIAVVPPTVPTGLSVIKERFLRHFRKASVEDVVITNPNDHHQPPMQHFHVRLYMDESLAQQMSEVQRATFLKGLEEDGKKVLSGYGLSIVEEVNIEAHKGMLQFDCETPERVQNRDAFAQAVKQDLQEGIDRAHGAGIVQR